MSGRDPVERVRGTLDVWWQEAEELEAIRRELAATVEPFGYRRIEVPAIEQLELHLRKSGGEIISKLYAFADQGGRRLCLRPELTASIVRACVARPAAALPLKLYACGPVFRYEKPQRGRYRQFTQMGVEAIGADHPVADAEVIYLAGLGLDTLGLTGYRIVVGHVGMVAAQMRHLGLSARLAAFLLEHLELARRQGLDAVRRRLAEHDPALAPSPEPAPSPLDLPDLAAHDEHLLRAVAARLLAEVGGEHAGRRAPEEIVERLVRKLRAGDDRQRVERALTFIGQLGNLRGAPEATLESGRRLLAGYDLDPQPLDELATILGLLDRFAPLNGEIELDLALSRGLAYYTGMVFEIYGTGTGAESQLCGGGRYDDLVRALGGRQSTPALGFAYGLERVRDAVAGAGRLRAPAGERTVFVATAGEQAVPYAVRVQQMLRRVGVAAQLDLRCRGLKSSLAFAHRAGFPQVVIVGREEEEAGTIRVRDLVTGGERVAPLTEVAAGRWPLIEGQPAAVEHRRELAMAGDRHGVGSEGGLGRGGLAGRAAARLSPAEH